MMPHLKNFQAPANFAFRASGLVLLSLILLPWGCGGVFNSAEVQVLEYLGSGTHMMYTARCDAQANDHSTSLATAGYVRPALDIQIWKGPGKGPQNSISDVGFTLAVEKGDIRYGLVAARAGLGKSSMLTAIEAETCQKIPVFRLDCVQDLLPAVRSGQRDGNAILYGAEMAMQTGFGDSSARSLAEMLKVYPSLFLIDSLDQVSQTERGLVVAEINSLMEKYPDTARAIVFARSPVFEDNFGLKGLDAKVSIRPLNCEQTQSRVQVLSENSETLSKFWKFAAATKLDHKAPSDGGCTYTHMATHRDVIVALSIAKNLEYDPMRLPEENRETITRSAIYQGAVGSLLDRSHIKLAFGSDQALATVDKIIDGKAPTVDTRSILLNPTDCPPHIEGENDKKRKEACAAFMLTALFRRIRGVDLWKFENNSLQDFFLGRWADRKIKEGGQIDCSRVAGLSPLFESNEVAGFFLGTESGQACAGELLQALATTNCSKSDAITILDQGLPNGFERGGVLKKARKATGTTEIDSYTTEILDILSKAPESI